MNPCWPQDFLDSRLRVQDFRKDRGVGREDDPQLMAQCDGVLLK